jgi:hypothetical protein
MAVFDGVGGGDPVALAHQHRQLPLAAIDGAPGLAEHHVVASAPSVGLLGELHIEAVAGSDAPQGHSEESAARDCWGESRAAGLQGGRSAILRQWLFNLGDQGEQPCRYDPQAQLIHRAVDRPIQAEAEKRAPRRGRPQAVCRDLASFALPVASDVVIHGPDEPHSVRKTDRQKCSVEPDPTMPQQ